MFTPFSSDTGTSRRTDGRTDEQTDRQTVGHGQTVMRYQYRAALTRDKMCNKYKKTIKIKKTYQMQELKNC